MSKGRVEKHGGRHLVAGTDGETLGETEKNSLLIVWPLSRLRKLIKSGIPGGVDLIHFCDGVTATQRSQIMHLANNRGITCQREQLPEGLIEARVRELLGLPSHKVLLTDPKATEKTLAGLLGLAERSLAEALALNTALEQQKGGLVAEVGGLRNEIGAHATERERLIAGIAAKNDECSRLAERIAELEKRLAARDTGPKARRPIKSPRRKATDPLDLLTLLAEGGEITGITAKDCAVVAKAADDDKLPQKFLRNPKLVKGPMEKAIAAAKKKKK